MEEYADLEGALRSCTKHLLGPRELRIQSGMIAWVRAVKRDSALATVQNYRPPTPAIISIVGAPA